jgi:3,4-dihydroxy 2-butanone 4-phosphate synthase
MDKALKDLASGKPILIFDAENRERETDIVFPSQFITPEILRFMRKEGGGLICTTIKQEFADRLGILYLEDILRNQYGRESAITRSDDMKYDRNSSFSLTINHRSTFTGVSDTDRSITISSLAKFINDSREMKDTMEEFAKSFRAPGHVILIIARANYFSQRRGHTELSTYMVERAGLIPSATIVEMLSDSGRSMTKEEAMMFAREHSLSFIEGKDIIASWLNDQGNGYGSVRYNPSGAHPLLEGIKEVG